MDEFSYLSVLVSLIIGLAITQILTGFRGLVQARGRVVTFAPTVIWAFALLPMNVQSWWAMFGMRTVREWTFFAFCVVLAQTALQYMLAALVLPDFHGDGTVDLRAHYFAHRRWFFGIAIALMLTSLAKDLVLGGHLPGPENVAAHGFFIATSTIAMLSPNERYHRVLAPLVLAVFLVYTALLFGRLA